MASVQPNKVVHDRETESEATISPCGRAVSLSKPIKYVGQKCRIDTDACVHNLDLNPGAGLSRVQ